MKPRTADINDNVLSEECRNDYGLNEENIKDGELLETVIEQVRRVCSAISSKSTTLHPSRKRSISLLPVGVVNSREDYAHVMFQHGGSVCGLGNTVFEGIPHYPINVKRLSWRPRS